MPTFLDVHPMKGTSEEKLKQLQTSPKDEFGVTHINILFNPEADKVFCIIIAPNQDSVQKHHSKLGIKCEWIMEVKTTA
jgi:Protein of unknown function (DUF4242)